MSAGVWVPPERRPEPIDMDDPEQLAEAASLGALEPDDLSKEQLVKLGNAHCQAVARCRELADRAQIDSLEAEVSLATARRDADLLRRINHELRALISTGRLTEHAPVALPELDQVDLLINTATMLAETADRRVALLIVATIAACLRHDHPDAALSEAIDTLRRDLEALRGLHVQRAGVPS